jgi:hypothetical protein
VLVLAEPQLAAIAAREQVVRAFVCYDGSAAAVAAGFVAFALLL